MVGWHGSAGEETKVTARRRRFGHVRQLPSGRWQASYEVDGQRYNADHTFLSDRQADQYLVLIESQLLRCEWVVPTLRKAPFGEFADKWYATTGHLSPKTRESYDSVLRTHLKPALGSMELGAIDYASVVAFLAAVGAEGAKPKTVRNVKAVLSAVLSHAVKCGILAANPCLQVHVGRVSPVEMMFLTVPEIEDLLDAIVSIQPKRSLGTERCDYGLAVRLDVTTGLRASELWALTDDRVVMDSPSLDVLEALTEPYGKLHLGPTKTYQRRRVPITAEVAELLSEHMSSAPRRLGRSPLFTTAEGDLVRHSNFYDRVFKPAAVHIGKPGLRFHDLRHSYAALLIALGAHSRAIMERMGHSNIATTMQTYGHLFPHIDSSLTVALGDMFDPTK